VLLADGEKLVRAGLRELLEEGGDIAVAEEAASGREAVALASEIRPDVVLMNVRLPGLDGVEATRLIIADPKLSGVEVLMLSDDEGDEQLFSAVRAGAKGFLIRDTEPAELLRAVRVLAGGGVQLSPSVARRLIDEVASQPDPQRVTPELFEELSDREREVVRLVALGLSNDEIAERLVVSPATAKTHVSRSMLKLHAHDRAKLVALAYQTGFAQPPRHPEPAAELQRQRAGAIAAGRGRSASGPRPDRRRRETRRVAPWSPRKV
jgi:DNA-binding NarL/FixJ family response regulator